MPDRTSPRPGAAPAVQIQFTIDDPGRADELVEQLLVDRLVACGQRVGPVVSRYWWHGALARAEEWLVLLKTQAGLAPAVVEAVVAAHPYETPEVVVLDVVAAAPGYRAWIEEVTAPATTVVANRETEER